MRNEYCDFTIRGWWGSIRRACSCKTTKDGLVGGCLKLDIQNKDVTLISGCGPEFDEDISGYCLRERIKRRTERKKH